MLLWNQMVDLILSQHNTVYMITPYCCNLSLNVTCLLCQVTDAALFLVVC